tara:strand:+ start:385 stop:933 length:549 start_codon:yes stop_codon:yes gene_type:complete
MIIFPSSFYDLEKDVQSFLSERNRNYSLWHWALSVPLLEQRFHNLLTASDTMIDYINDNNFTKRSVLDLGCGFCSYWPFLKEYGFDQFVGVDLYSLRNEGRQMYIDTAIDLVKNFCPDCSFSIYEQDVRQLGNVIGASQKFDLIFTKNTNYQKLGSTGIPRDIFDDIVERYLAKDGIAIYAG